MLVDDSPDHRLDLARETAQAQQGRSDVGVEFGGQRREQAMANPVSGPPHVEVGRVQPVWLTDVLQVGADLLAPEVEQRSDKRRRLRQGPHAPHPSEPADARSPKDAVKNRLGLIVGGVGHGNVAGPTFAAVSAKN
jgi:hypothetical protein